MIKLSLIGGGGIARAHAAAVESLSGRVEAVAVVDPDAGKADPLAERLGAEPFSSLDELLGRGELAEAVDAVLVCTPPSARVELVERSLQRGWSVLCEKPLAHRLIDSERLVRLANEHAGRVCAAGLCHRFTPAVAEMARRAAAGELGTLVRVENVFAASLPHMDGHWMSDPTVSGGGSLLDAGTHSIDLMNYLVGPCASAGAVLSRAWAGRGDSNATVLLQSHGGGAASAHEGVACQIATGWHEPTRFQLRLVGSAASLSYDFDVPEELVMTRSTGAVERIAVETHEVRFTRQLEAFIDSVEAGSMRSPLASFEDAHRVMRLVDGIDGALERGTKVVADASAIDGLPRGRSSRTTRAAVAG